MFDIIHLLTGDSAFPPSLDSMVNLYVEKRRFDFEQVAWYSHYLDRDRALRFVDVYEALPDPSRLHLLLSPATYEAVREFHKERSLERLEDLIGLSYDESVFVSGIPSDGHHDGIERIWAPMGDEMLLRTGDGWERRSAAKLDSLVVIDFDSPQARTVRPTSPLMYRPAEDFTDVERENVVMKLEQALKYIDSVAPTFGRLIRNYTRAIRIRKCEQDSDVASEHVTNTIGEIRIMNAQKDDYGSARLAETLVHESVHNLLSVYEYVNQSFVFSTDEKRYRPVSPWTGNPIPVPSFCHAVFVWFALFNFAQRELEQPGLSEELRIEIQRRRNNYACGFLIPTPIFECVRDLALFDSIVPSTLNTLQTVVRSYVHGGSRLAHTSAAATPSLR